MDPKKRAAEVNTRLKKRYPDAKCSLDFTNAFELLIATILAAQSTDARVNIVTKSLFRKYPDPRAFASADLVEMETAVKQTGFFRNKAKAVINCSKAIVEKHGGQVPKTMEELTALPGVGRKTANVVLGNAFGIPAGIVVDTHVGRVSGRLALTSNADPEKIEQDLTPLLPRSEWTAFAHRRGYARGPRLGAPRADVECGPGEDRAGSHAAPAAQRVDGLRASPHRPRPRDVHGAQAAVRAVRAERNLPVGGDYGGSTVPEGVHGPHRAIRQSVFAEPFANPSFAIAARP